ncbi:hypothetical protein BJI67_06520 [Acidihalobacter aeolianus]|uniref:Uncharacterized protein n=1 Tax=Acidihalobacter aeolianus TaxID=2792603 RepID=A0A1D8K731_9GAMM|nr:hypothetical protein [Acidihalobacter aeolianus]AOV16761.1 hypothetical protein BJI67_06520 [Acidihalobacter aeolianus]
MKKMKPFTGNWRIVEMEVWDQDYVDMEVPGYFRIGSDGTGQFQFGLVSGDIDGRVEPFGHAPRFEFSWSGQDENDPICGRGWAAIENNELNGRIYLHLADDSAFRAIKSK